MVWILVGTVGAIALLSIGYAAGQLRANEIIETQRREIWGLKYGIDALKDQRRAEAQRRLNDMRRFQWFS